MENTRKRGGVPHLGRNKRTMAGGATRAGHAQTERPFLGPVIVLTGPETFSAAENFVVLLHASKRATVVGERTGGSTGDSLIIDLPGDVTAHVCTAHATYPDGREFVGVGVIPDVEVHPTAVDIATDRDVVLEKGVALLKAACAPKSSGKL